MQRSRKLRFNSEQDDDPLSGMANLFDIAMVFALALMVALVVRLNISEMLLDKDFTMVKNPGKENMEIIRKEGKKIEKYKASKGSSEGKGKKIGIAYELDNGEIIYVPE